MVTLLRVVAEENLKVEVAVHRPVVEPQRRLLQVLLIRVTATHPRLIPPFLNLPISSLASILRLQLRWRQLVPHPGLPWMQMFH